MEQDIEIQESTVELMLPSALPDSNLVYFQDQDTSNILAMLEIGPEKYGVSEEELTHHLMEKPRALQEGNDMLSMMEAQIKGRAEMLKAALDAEKAKLSKIKATKQRFNSLSYKVIEAIGEPVNNKSNSSKVIIGGQTFTAKLSPGRVVQAEGFEMLPPKHTRLTELVGAVIHDGVAYAPLLDKKSAGQALKLGEDLSDFGISLEQDVLVSVR